MSNFRGSQFHLLCSRLNSHHNMKGNVIFCDFVSILICDRYCLLPYRPLQTRHSQYPSQLADRQLKTADYRYQDNAGIANICAAPFSVTQAGLARSACLPVRRIGYLFAMPLPYLPGYSVDNFVLEGQSCPHLFIPTE